MLLFLKVSMFCKPSFLLRPSPGRNTPAVRGLTLVEVLVSMAILVLTTVGGVSGFMIFNNYAASSRNISSAKALCQERIEEVQTMPFTPPNAVPTVVGQMDTPFSTPPKYTNYFLLGPGSNSVDSQGNAVPPALTQVLAPWLPPLPRAWPCTYSRTGRRSPCWAPAQPRLVSLR